MPTYHVPVAVIADNKEAAEQYVEGLLKGRKPAELPEAEFDWVGDAELQDADPPEGPFFGDIELTPFKPDGDTGEYDEGVVRLDSLPDGALFEDAEGRVFNVVSQGPTQGSTEIVDDNEVHAYFDCGTRVTLHGLPETETDGHGDLDLSKEDREVLRKAGFVPWGKHGWVRFTDDGSEQGGTCYDDKWALREARSEVDA